MADIILDGRVKVWSVPTISNIAAPTTAELNAGISLALYMPKDGVKGVMPDTGEVDNTKLNSTYGTSLPGLGELKPGSLTFFRQTGTDTVWSTFVKDYNTNLVIRRQGSLETAAWALTDKVEVFPIQCGFRQDQDFAENELQKYTVPIFFYLTPNQVAVVA